MFSQRTRYASHLDIVIEEAEMDIRMAYDTMGKLLLEDVSPAAESVTYVFDIKSPAAPEQISELIYLIERGCHTMNTIKAPTPVSAKVVHNGVELPVRDQEPYPAQA
jgi:hypothetical protein